MKTLNTCLFSILFKFICVMYKAEIERCLFNIMYSVRCNFESRQKNTRKLTYQFSNAPVLSHCPSSASELCNVCDGLSSQTLKIWVWRF